MSDDTEEFQLVYPRSASELRFDVERELVARTPWPEVLQALYGATTRELETQRCVLLTDSTATAVSTAQSVDRFRRKMVVVVAASETIDWASEGVEDSVAAAVARSRHAAAELAERFSDAPSDIEAALIDGAFEVGFRGYAGPSDRDRRYWSAAINSAREWKGVSGFCTPLMLPLGGNIIMGTEHEAVRLAGTGGASVSGYFLLTERRIEPISGQLTRWPEWRPEHKPAEAVATEPERPDLRSGGATAPDTVLDPPSQREVTISVAQEAPQVTTPNAHETMQRLESIDQSLQGIDRSLSTLAQVAVRLVEVAVEVWFGGGSGKKRKR